MDSQTESHLLRWTSAFGSLGACPRQTCQASQAKKRRATRKGLAPPPHRGKGGGGAAAAAAAAAGALRLRASCRTPHEQSVTLTYDAGHAEETGKGGGASGGGGGDASWRLVLHVVCGTAPALARIFFTSRWNKRKKIFTSKF